MPLSPDFYNVYGAQESISRNKFRQPTVCCLAGRYDNPIPTRFLAPIDCFKIAAVLKTVKAKDRSNNGIASLLRFSLITKKTHA
jgi:hypothetical protein